MEIKKIIFFFIILCILLIFKFIYLEKFKNSVSTSSQPPSNQSNQSQSYTSSNQSSQPTSGGLLDNSVDELISKSNTFEDYFQGGFCKYQETLGNYVGCSDHIYDKSYFNLDRELDSVKPEYTILSS